MARGTSSKKHQSSIKNQSHGSLERGHNQMSSQPNHQCAYNERIHVPAYIDPALPNPPYIFAPGQHAELRFSSTPLPEMESYPYYSENYGDPKYAYMCVEAPQQEISPGRGVEDVVPLTSTQKQLERYGCYSIPSSQDIMTYPVGQCLPTLYEDFLHVQNNAYPSCLYPKADEPSIFHEQSNAFSSCLYPKQVKIKLNVKPAKKPPEPMEIGEMIRPRDRNVRVSLMASTDSPEQISFKLLHEEPVLEPEPENIEMPLELMPLPPPPEEVVEVKLLPVGDSHKAHAKQHVRSCLGISTVVMRALGIGAYVGLAMAHQFAVYSVKVLKNGLHVYGPMVAKATVSSYKGLIKGSKVFLHKSAPIANHARKVTLAHIRKTQEGCVQEMMKQCLACFPSTVDAEDELEYFEEIQQPGSNRPSHYDNELAWKDSLRLYPEPKEESEPKLDSEVNSTREECMAENSQDKPTPELSVLEDYPYYSHKRDCTSPHNKKTLGRLSTRNFDNLSSIVPHKGAGIGNSPDSLSRFRKRLSLSLVRNNQRENFRTQGLGTLVWPRPDIRRFSDPLRGHQFIPNLAVRAGTKNYRDLVQESPLEDEVIWRRTLRAYFPEKGAEVRPEDVLLCRQAVPMKLLSKEEFERNKEDSIMGDRCGRLGLGCYPYYSNNLEAGKLSYASYPKRELDYQHIKRPLLQISHGDKIVHHCIPKQKPHPHALPNRGEDNRHLGHSSLAHIKHGDFGSVAKSHDHNEKLMRNESSSGISSIHSQMKDGDFWQANPIHSFESNWKGMPIFDAPHPHGRKRPHSPQLDLMEELPHSPKAIEKSNNLSRAHPLGKHQKLEVMSSPDSFIQAKFSKKPLRISKHKLSSDRSKFGSPAESRESRTPLKTKSQDSHQSTPLKGRPPYHIPKISQTPRKSLVGCLVRFAHILCSCKHSHSIPRLSRVKTFDHQIPSNLCLRSSDPFLRGKKPMFLNGRGYRKIHPQPSKKPYKSNLRTLRMGDGFVSHMSSRRQPSADDFKGKPRRFFFKKPVSCAPSKSYAPDVHSEGKSKSSLFKNGLSFLRDSLSPQILRKPSGREDETLHPSTQSSFWNLRLRGKFCFFTLKKSSHAPRPHSPGMRPSKSHDHPNAGEILHREKRDQCLTPLQSQGSQRVAKRWPLYEYIPRLKIFLSKKDPHGIQSLSQRKCRQHGTVLRIKSPKKNLPSTRGDKRTKTTSNLLKSQKKDITQLSPRSCISFPYPIAVAKRKPVDGNIRGRSSSPKNQPKKTANSHVTPSSPGKTSKWPNTKRAMARSLSPSPSKRGRKVQLQNPLDLQHRYDNYAPLESELSSINANNSSYIHEGQILDMVSEKTSKPRPDGAAKEKGYVENLSPAAVNLSFVQDTIESVHVGSTHLNPASTTSDTSKSAILQPSEMMIDKGDEDGDDSSSDTPYQLNPEISKLLTSYRQALLKEARKEVKPSSIGHLESELVQDSGAKLQPEVDAAPQPYQKSPNFDEQKLSPLSELFHINKQTPEFPSNETLHFDVASKTSPPDSFKESIESIEPHEQKNNVNQTQEGEGESIVLENFDEQKRGVDHAREGKGVLENNHHTLPAHLDKHEQRDELHFYSRDRMSLSLTDHSFAKSGQQSRAVEHAREGDGALENHQLKFPARFDKIEQEDEIHLSPLVGINLSPTYLSFANSGKLTKDTELFQTLDQPKDVHGQQYLGHLNKGHDQDEKSLASLTIDTPFDKSHVDKRLPQEHHNIILEYTTIIQGVQDSPRECQAKEGHDQGGKSSASLSIDQPLALPTETLQRVDQTPPQSNDVLNPQLFDVKIATPDKIIFNSKEYEEPDHGANDGGQMSMIGEPIDNQAKEKIEQVEGDSPLGSPTSQSPYLYQDDSENMSSSLMITIKRTMIEGDTLQKEKRNAWEVVSSAEKELDDTARRSLPPLQMVVKDYDNSKHKTPNEFENQSPSLVISKIQQEIPRALVLVKKDESLYHQELQVNRQEEPEDVNSFTPRQLHGAIQIDKDGEYEEPVKPKHHDKHAVEQDEAGYQAPEEHGKFFQNIETTYHQMLQVGDEKDKRQSFVSSGLQRLNTELDMTPKSTMTDENFPKLELLEELTAWETLAQSYKPPAKHQGWSDDMTTIVKVTSRKDQSPLESCQIRGLDLAKPSTEHASKLQSYSHYENSTAHPKRSKERLELSREYSIEEESQHTTDDLESLIISKEDHSQLASRVDRRRDNHKYVEDFPTLKSESIVEKSDIYLQGISGHVDERLCSKHVHNLILESTPKLRGLHDSPLERQADKSHDQPEKSSTSFSTDRPIAQPTESFQLLDQTPPPANDVSMPQQFDVEIEIDEEIIFDYNDEYEEQGHKTDEGHMSMATKHVDNQGIEKIEQVEGEHHLGSPSSRSPHSNQDDFENWSSNLEKLLKRNIIEGDSPRKEKRKAWKVVSSAKQELDDNGRSPSPLKMDIENDTSSSFESESNFGTPEGKVEKFLGSYVDLGILVSPQSVSESYETANEQGFATTSDSDGEVHQSRSFKGLLSESETSSPSSLDEKNFVHPTHSRQSVFTRPALKKSLIRTSKNEETFATLQQVKKNFESPVSSVDLSPNGSSSQGSLDGTSTPPARSKSSIFTRPILKKSLVQNLESEQMFAQLAAKKNYQLDELPSVGIEHNAQNKQINNIREEGFRRSSSFDGLDGSSQSDSLLDESQSESRWSSPSTLQGSDENVIPPPNSRKRKSLFTRPLLKPSLVATSKTAKLFSRLQTKQNEDNRNEEGFDAQTERGIRRSSSFESILGSNSPKSLQGPDEISMPARPRKSLLTCPILKQSLDDKVGLLQSSSFKDGLEPIVSSQLSQGNSIFSPHQLKESEGNTRWEDLPQRDRLDQPRRSALKRSIIGTLDAEQSINEQKIHKRVKIDPSFTGDTSSEIGAKSSASEASKTIKT